MDEGFYSHGKRRCRLSYRGYWPVARRPPGGMLSVFLAMLKLWSGPLTVLVGDVKRLSG